MVAGAGASQNGAQVNGLAGALAKEVESLFLRLKEFQTFSAATDLKVAPYSLSSADEADVKSFASTMAALITIYEGGSTVGTANQSKTFTARLTGFGAHN